MSPLQLIVVIYVTVLALTFGIDKSLSCMWAASCGPASAKSVIAVITHAHSVYWKVSMLTVCDLTFFTSCFSCFYSTGFWTDLRTWAPISLIRAHTASWTFFCRCSCLFTTFFRAYFWIWTVLYLRWTDAPSYAWLNFKTSLCSAWFLTDSWCLTIFHISWANTALQTNIRTAYILIFCDHAGWHLLLV